MGEISMDEIDNLITDGLGESGGEDESSVENETNIEINDASESDGILSSDLLQDLEDMAKSPINYKAEAKISRAPIAPQKPPPKQSRIAFSNTNARNLKMLLEVPMQVVVEIGRTTKLVKEILALGEGSIIEFDKIATEPVDILVNNKIIGRGEVVVVDENFGVRITKIISLNKRL